MRRIGAATGIYRQIIDRWLPAAGKMIRLQSVLMRSVLFLCFLGRIYFRFACQYLALSWFGVLVLVGATDSEVDGYFLQSAAIPLLL